MSEQKKPDADQPTPQNTPKILNLRKNLPCQLTPDERLERGIELARVRENISNEEKRQSDLKADMKSKMTALESESSMLGTIVRRNEEYRDVDVQEIYNYEDKVVEQFRTDTGERIYKRDMTDAELQEGLPLEPADE